MGYILFLISVLISSFFYFRIAHRFDGFNAQLEDDLKREMDSLILDFNQTATQNITILEDRILDGKNMLQDLAVQIKYLKDLKDALDGELRDMQKTYNHLQQQQIINEAKHQQKTLVQTTYESVANSTNMIQSQKSETKRQRNPKNLKVKPPVSKKNQKDPVSDYLDIDMGLFQDVQNKIQREKPLKRKVSQRKKAPLHPNVPSKKGIVISSNERSAVSGKKEKILVLHEQGRDIVDIAQELALPKGEVELIIKLFYS